MGGHDQRDRVGGEDQEGAIQDWQAGRCRGDHVRTMERSTGCLMPIESSDTAQRQSISYLTPRASQPRTARKTASNSWRRSESGTARMRMTLGLTLRRTARRINRLNETRMLILSGYAAQ